MMSNRLDKVFLAHNSQLMVMVMHLSSAFSMCIYSNALYNTSCCYRERVYYSSYSLAISLQLI